jgi:hypothetical protein
MATSGAIGKRRAEAVGRIEQRCAAWGGGQTLTLPRFNRHGADMLLVAQLEAIADFLEAVELPTIAATKPRPKPKSKSQGRKAQHA